MTFHGIAPRESAVDACAAAVKEAILGGTLRPGARLPPERELAESLGVSRLTLRAGLGKLASVGLLSVKHGSGYSVRDYRRSGGIELLPGLARLARRRDQLAEIAADLLRVRRQLARTVLEQIAQARRRGADRRVGVAIDAFAAELAARDQQRIAAADLDVVAALLEETGSAVLALCLNPVMQVVATIDALREAIYAEPERNLLGWRALQVWLARPDPARIDQMIALLLANDRATVQRLGAPRAPRRRAR